MWILGVASQDSLVGFTHQILFNSQLVVLKPQLWNVTCSKKKSYQSKNVCTLPIVLKGNARLLRMRDGSNPGAPLKGWSAAQPYSQTVAW